MKTAKFEVGYKTWYAGLYGGVQDVEVVGRTEDTITIRTSWVAEDTGNLCYADDVLNIETEMIEDTQVERAVVWTYGDAKGYIYCLSESEIFDIHNNYEKENENMNTNTFTTVNGTTFTANESGTYFYAIWTEDGKQIKKRIKKAEYEAAKREHELEVDAKMHENLEKLVAGTEESNTDEEIAAIIESMDADAEEDSISAEEFIEKVQKVEKQKTRKAKKAKNKNAALRVWVKDGKLVSENEGNMLELTAKQVDFLQHLPDTCFWEEGLDSCIWVDCLCDDIKGQFERKPMTVGAMVSTICEKNLGTRGTDRRNGRKCTSFRLTELGKQVAAELGVR